MFHILCITYLLTYSMQQSPSWEANQFSASQEIPCILRNPKVHYHVYKWPPPVPTLSQINPVHAHPHPFLKIHHNIILPTMPGSSKWRLSFTFPTKTLHAPLLFPICATCPTHLILLNMINQIILGEECRSLNSSLRSFLHSPATLSHLGLNILLSTPFSNDLQLCALIRSTKFINSNTFSPVH